MSYSAFDNLNEYDSRALGKFTLAVFALGLIVGFLIGVLV